MILQTLSSVQASLARSRAAAVPLAAPDVEEIKQTVTQINAQAQAVEQAVQEVMALRIE
jgi:hypothetical protein